MPTPEPVRRRAPRATVDLAVTLVRPKGSPIASRSVDVGLGGMRVTCRRPLTIDERLAFELAPTDSPPLAGRARVLREHLNGVYALQFESLPPEVAERLSRLVHVR
jgi:hypothetical protein